MVELSDRAIENWFLISVNLCACVSCNHGAISSSQICKEKYSNCHNNMLELKIGDVYNTIIIIIIVTDGLL